MTERMKKIAVIGGGISGLVAAYYLSRHRDVVLFEQGGALGGHTKTCQVLDGPDAPVPVDMGFIVFNDRTYPHFCAFLQELGVSSASTDMTFAYYNLTKKTGYAGTGLNGLFANRKNILNIPYWLFLFGVWRFGYAVDFAYRNGRLKDLTLGEFWDGTNFSPRVLDEFVLPMVGAIWSAPDDSVMNFPMESFARFFANHGLLRWFNRPNWLYIPGGSSRYVQAFTERFPGTIRLKANVQAVRRLDSAIEVCWNGETEVFDAVVLATHADQSLRLLEQPSVLEEQLLGPWKYSKNRTILHSDASVLPPRERNWASWISTMKDSRQEDAPVSVHYYMNRLQHLQADNSYVVSLNPDKAITQHKVHHEELFEHPQYSMEAMHTQEYLCSLNGKDRVWFCGAYQFNGFHEDGVRSALRVVRDFGEEQ